MYVIQHFFEYFSFKLNENKDIIVFIFIERANQFLQITTQPVFSICIFELNQIQFKTGG